MPSCVRQIRVCGSSGTCTIEEPPDGGVSITVKLNPFGERSQIHAILRSITLQVDLGENGTRDVATTGLYSSRGMGKDLLLCGRLEGVSVSDLCAVLVQVGGDVQRISLDS